MGFFVTPSSWISGALYWVYRAVSATWRVRFVDREVLTHALNEGPVVIAIWHGEQALLLHAHRHMGIDGMASRSRDGERLAGALKRLGYGIVRGSTSRNALSAMRAALRSVDGGRSMALAVDGPRGPARVAQMGALHLAARTGCPVIYMVAHAKTAMRLRTWDRFVLPAPGTKITIGYGRLDAPDKGRAAVRAAAEDLDGRMAALSARLSPFSLSPLEAPVSAG